MSSNSTLVTLCVVGNAILRAGGLQFNNNVLPKVYQQALKESRSEIWAWMKVMDKFLRDAVQEGPFLEESTEFVFSYSSKGTAWNESHKVDKINLASALRVLLRNSEDQSLQNLQLPLNGISEGRFLLHFVKSLGLENRQDEIGRPLWFGVVNGTSVCHAISKDGKITAGMIPLRAIRPYDHNPGNGSLVFLLPGLGAAEKFIVNLGPAKDFPVQWLLNPKPEEFLQKAFNLAPENEGKQAVTPAPVAPKVILAKDEPTPSSPSKTVTVVLLPKVPGVPKDVAGLPQVIQLLSKLDQLRARATDTNPEIAAMQALEKVRDAQPARIKASEEAVTAAEDIVRKMEKELREARALLEESKKELDAASASTSSCEDALQGARNARETAAKDFLDGIGRLQALTQALDLIGA